MRFINNRASSWWKHCKLSQTIAAYWWLMYHASQKWFTMWNHPSRSSGAHVKVSSGAQIMPEIFLPEILLTMSWNCCFLRITVFTIQPSLSPVSTKIFIWFLIENHILISKFLIWMKLPWIVYQQARCRYPPAWRESATVPYKSLHLRIHIKIVDHI